MAFQKRIEYKILFTYIKSILTLLITNLKKFQLTSIRKREEPTVREFRDICNVFGKLQAEEDKNRAMHRQTKGQDLIEPSDHNEQQHIIDFRNKKYSIELTF